MRIVALHVENVKRLKAVDITPDGNMVVVGGRNAQGKSSLLDSITMALGGQSVFCDRPLREGAESGEIIVDLGDLVVKRTFAKDGGTALVVKGKDGNKHKSPQTLLDNLVGRITFDPMAFSRMDPKKQLETLTTLVGLDFRALDAKRLTLADDRTQVGRDGQARKAQRDAMPHHPDVPAEEVSANEIIAQVEVARHHNAKRLEMQRQADAASQQAIDLRGHVQAIKEGRRLTPEIVRYTRTIAEAQSRQQSLREEVERLEKRLAEIRPMLSPLATEIDTMMENVKTATELLVTQENEKALAAAKESEALTDQVNGISEKPVAELLERISKVDIINRKVRENLAQKEQNAYVEKCMERWQELTAAINVIDQQKKDAMAKVAFPVEGLSFNDTGVLFKGVPFSQASSAEQLRVSVAMGLALNPKLRVVLIRDGSLLDDENMALIAKMAAEKDSQVWVERVGNGEEVSVLIEDGSVVADDQAVAP